MSILKRDTFSSGLVLNSPNKTDSIGLNLLLASMALIGTSGF